MSDKLTKIFSALADPTRRAILTQLLEGEANVTDLAKPFLNEMSLPAVTKHLKVLENAGLIIKTKAAQWRSCQINAAPLKDATDWIDQYREHWEESFDRLDDYLKIIQRKNKTKGLKDGHRKTK